GDYTPLDLESKNTFSYLRELNGDRILVVSNFYEEETEFNLKGIEYSDLEILISNYKDSSKELKSLKLRPFEAIMFRLK
ncbi:MAG: alpha-glucosidase C-terminal domain-containing protein, partial [Clostridium sp.]